MTKRMLIDAAHPDETRVAMLDQDQVYDYDFITSAKTLTKGNIYLAKITRVEPSLQAAFVEYGGGKQGFLPFSEIHPDYYQLPQSDKEKLLAEQIAEAEADAPQAGHRFDETVAVHVLDIDAVALVDDERADLRMPPGIGVGVQHVRDVARLDRVGDRRDDRLVHVACLRRRWMRAA